MIRNALFVVAVVVAAAVVSNCGGNSVVEERRQNTARIIDTAFITFKVVASAYEAVRPDLVRANSTAVDVIDSALSASASALDIAIDANNAGDAELAEQAVACGVEALAKIIDTNKGVNFTPEVKSRVDKVLNSLGTKTCELY